MMRETDKNREKTKKADTAQQLDFEDPDILSDTDLQLKDAEVTAQESDTLEIQDDQLLQVDEQDSVTSVAAKTYTKKPFKVKFHRASGQKKWHKVTTVVIGVLALITLAGSGLLSQYFKHKTLPNVYVAGVATTAKTSEQVKEQLRNKQKLLSISFKAEEKEFKPKFEDIGFQIDIDKTAENALSAKRKSGVFTKVKFWERKDIPAVVKVNNSLLNQYLELNIPSFVKAPVDSRLQFDAKKQTFIITPQADGQGPDVEKIQQQIYSLSSNLNSKVFNVAVAKKTPSITEEKLKPLIEPATEITKRKVILTGLGYTYQALPSDTANWLVPTPQKDTSVKLVIDSASVQSYVESISKRISNKPTDRKILKNETAGTELVIQAGRDGTELVDKQKLATAITNALNNGLDITQTMDIRTAAYQTVNMNTYEKWIEIDISSQQTIAYERDIPLKKFTIASGRRGYETVIGDFEIWHKNRKQTMQGGSRASGDYYNTPNVEWVSYFYKDYALHGAWWQNNFGVPGSRGCVNMTNADAKWIYEWAPVGTKVIVHA